MLQLSLVNKPGTLNKEILVTHNDADPLRFSTYGFEKLHTTRDEDLGRRVFLPINRFFKTLEPKERDEIYWIYFIARSFGNASQEPIARVTTGLANRLRTVIEQYDLIGKLLAFTKEEEFPYPPLEAFDKKPYRDDSRSFTRPEFVELTTMAMFSKLISPITSVLFEGIPTSREGGVQRDILGYGLIKDILEQSVLENTNRKLKNWTSFLGGYLIKKRSYDQISRDDALPITEDTYNIILYSSVIVRRFVLLEPYQLDDQGRAPHIMRIANDMVTRQVRSRAGLLISHSIRDEDKS